MNTKKRVTIVCSFKLDSDNTKTKIVFYIKIRKVLVHKIISSFDSKQNRQHFSTIVVQKKTYLFLLAITPAFL